MADIGKALTNVLVHTGVSKFGEKFTDSVKAAAISAEKSNKPIEDIFVGTARGFGVATKESFTDVKNALTGKGVAEATQNQQELSDKITELSNKKKPIKYVNPLTGETVDAFA